MALNPDFGSARSVHRPSDDDLLRARHAVRAALVPSPLIAAPALGANVWVKAESLLPTGSFKPRGALAALSALPPERKVVLSSAGNAAIAVAWAARRFNRVVRIIVPETASPAKIAKMRSYGSHVQLVGRSFDEAEARALDLARYQDAYYLSSYNDTGFIAGLATIAEEICPPGDPTTIIVPIGGGGLASGICAWVARRPEIRVVGVQAAHSPAMGHALAAGHAVRVDIKPTLAEGLAGNIEPGSITIDMLKDRLDDLVDVEETGIAEAIRYLAREHCLLAEGAGAVATAALLTTHRFSAGRVVAILSGGNVSLTDVIDATSPRGTR